MHFTSIVIECWVGDPDADGVLDFSHKLLVILVYYFEMRDVISGMIIRLTMNINCTSFITTVFLYSIF